MRNLEMTGIKRILCLGAHADDIEVGCGGTILRLLDEIDDLSVCWVTLGARGERAKEAWASAETFIGRSVGREIIVRSYRDSYFPSQWHEIKTDLHEIARENSPDLIFTPRLEDRHQDHRVVAELTWCVFRDHLILEYEIPKYEGDLAAPNLFVPLSEETCRKKVRSIVDGFPSQHEKSWFSEDTFWALLRIRGVECNSSSRYAEGFTCRKMVL